MSIKNAALILNELNHYMKTLPEGRLKIELEGHIEDICKALLHQCVIRNRENLYHFHITHSDLDSRLKLAALDRITLDAQQNKYYGD